MGYHNIPIDQSLEFQPIEGMAASLRLSTNTSRTEEQENPIKFLSTSTSLDQFSVTEAKKKTQKVTF